MPFGFGGGSGSSGGSGHTIKDEGTPLTQRTGLNFTGAGVTVTDDAANDETDVSISGAAVGFGSPSASAVADASADGVSGNASRADHVHAREAFGAIGTSAVGDAAANGVATTVSRSDHKHGREAFAGTGSAATIAHSDHTHTAAAAYTTVQEDAVGLTQRSTLNFANGLVATDDAGNTRTNVNAVYGSPASSAVADSAADGTAVSLARSDHKHAREAFASPTSLSVGGASAAGSATTIPHSDHAHAITDIVSRGGSILDPSGARNIVVWRAPYACTVTNVRGFRKGGTGATINARRNGTSNHLASDLSLSSATTWTDGGAVSNTAYAIGDYLEIMLVTITGTVTEIDIQVDFTRP